MRVTLSINVAAVAGDQPAATAPPLTLRGQQVSIVLAGVDGASAPIMESWRNRAPQVQLAKPIKLPLAQLTAAGVEGCEALGRHSGFRRRRQRL